MAKASRSRKEKVFVVTLSEYRSQSGIAFAIGGCMFLVLAAYFYITNQNPSLIIGWLAYGAVAMTIIYVLYKKSLAMFK
ncbi:MAG: hypothetical protein J4431_01115 [Candidatus Aenigmarchaeota archaeon]|nr:hypothetical protein [Candidatus Aenigmarchaeota archaeon]